MYSTSRPMYPTLLFDTILVCYNLIFKSSNKKGRRQRVTMATFTWCVSRKEAADTLMFQIHAYISTAG